VREVKSEVESELSRCACGFLGLSFMCCTTFLSDKALKHRDPRVCNTVQPNGI
jgi:hypothetical protein